MLTYFFYYIRAFRRTCSILNTKYVYIFNLHCVLDSIDVSHYTLLANRAVYHIDGLRIVSSSYLLSSKTSLISLFSSAINSSMHCTHVLK